MINMPAKCKLTGNAKHLWEIMVADLGSVLRDRHTPALFAMCQQWDLYQKNLAKYKRNKVEKDNWILFCQMSGSLKLFALLAKNFQVGINDQLEFHAGGDLVDAVAKSKQAKSRLGVLMGGGSLN